MRLKWYLVSAFVLKFGYEIDFEILVGDLRVYIGIAYCCLGIGDDIWNCNFRFWIYVFFWICVWKLELNSWFGTRFGIEIKNRCNYKRTEQEKEMGISIWLKDFVFIWGFGIAINKNNWKKERKKKKKKKCEKTLVRWS